MKLLNEAALKHGASKGDDYLDVYEANFSGIRDSVKNILELGVQGGGSLKMWQDYFPNAHVFGVDIADCSGMAQDRKSVV